MLDTTKIGDSIHAHRKRAGLTQRKLGELARIGISNISSYENGKIPCLYNAIAIADALRVSLDDLIGRVVMDCPTLTPPNEPLTLDQLRGMANKPFPGGKRGRPKKRTNEERLKQMGTQELARELSLIAMWDRKQLKKAQENPGLEAFMGKWLREPAEDN